ncbi:uncharacterized protein LOC135804887 [Sycon ciliatum]|uniref:uncharacterized protein LOC135804887 n=1 Tax=Sycon ciliatum TaxID=27933 RepID=UPI0020ADD2B7
MATMKKHLGELRKRLRSGTTKVRATTTGTAGSSSTVSTCSASEASEPCTKQPCSSVPGGSACSCAVPVVVDDVDNHVFLLAARCLRDAPGDAAVIKQRSQSVSVTIPASVKGESAKVELGKEFSSQDSSRSHRTFSDCCKRLVKGAGRRVGGRSRRSFTLISTENLESTSGSVDERSSPQSRNCNIADEFLTSTSLNCGTSGTDLVPECDSGVEFGGSCRGLNSSSASDPSYSDKHSSVSSGLSDRSATSLNASTAVSRYSAEFPDNPNESMLMARHPAALSDRPLPQLPPPRAITAPISTAVQSAVARELTRTMARRATVSTVHFQNGDQQQDDDPPPLPPRSPPSAATSPDDSRTAALPPRRLPAATAPPPPPRNIPESSSGRTGSVYDDPEALERAFGPLRDVGRWYRSVAAQQLAMHHSGMQISEEDGWSSVLSSLRRTRPRAWTSPAHHALTGTSTAASSVNENRVSRIAGDAAPPRIGRGESDDVIYGRLPASPAHTSLLKGLEGLVKQGWYWGPVSRTEAEELLEGLPDGTFLVRDSTDDRYLLSVTFRSVGRTLHTRVQHFHGAFSLYENPTRSRRCQTVVELIDSALAQSQAGAFCHSTAVPGQNPVPVRLQYPHSRFRTMRSLQQQCRFVIRQTTRYDLICELPLPKMMHTYLLESPFVTS